MFKKYLLRCLRYFAIAVIAFISMVLFYFLTDSILSRIMINSQKVDDNADSYEIYLISNGVHTDIVMPTKSDLVDWSKKIKYSDTKGNDSILQYIAIGWGDKGFYLNTPTWSQLKASVAFKAVFGLSSTAMHSGFFKEMKTDNNCAKLSINKDEYKRLIEFIQKSFKTDSNGNYINIKTDAVNGLNDAFYEANGVYSMFYTCNSWTNGALKSAGQKACVWTAFESGIMRQYRK